MKYLKAINLITYTDINDFNKESFVNCIMESKLDPHTKHAFGIGILHHITGRFDVLPYFTFLQISTLDYKKKIVEYFNNMYEEIHKITLESMNESYFKELEK
jgi:hypothetical protein